MKRNIKPLNIAALLAITLTLLLSFSVSTAFAMPGDTVNDPDLWRVYDGGDYIEDDVQTQLDAKAVQISEKYGIDVVVWIVPSTEDKSHMDYADDDTIRDVKLERKEEEISVGTDFLKVYNMWKTNKISKREAAKALYITPADFYIRALKFENALKNTNIVITPTKDDLQNAIDAAVDNYIKDSYKGLVSTLLKEEKLSVNELRDLISQVDTYEKTKK